MIISPNIGLAIWNSVLDNYSHDQLADNWAKMDFHDHSPGRGMQIPTEGLKDGAVTAAKLAPGANSIENGSITPSKFGVLPSIKVYSDAAATLTSGTEALLSFNRDRGDNTGMHDPALNPTRVTVATPGLYLVTASIWVSSFAAGLVRLSLYRGVMSDLNLLARNSIGTNALSTTVTTFARFGAGEYAQAAVLQTTGGNINVLAGSATAEGVHDMGMVWIAP